MAGKGGATPGAGRKPSSLTIKTREAAEKLALSGIGPLEVLIQTMRHLWSQAIDKSSGLLIDIDKALEASELAKEAAPYMHPKLQAIQAEVDQRLTAQVFQSEPLSDDQWEQQHGPKPKAVNGAGSNGHGNGTAH